MTAEDKALDLFQKFYKYFPSTSGINFENAQCCAEECVLEIISLLDDMEQRETGKVWGAYGQSEWKEVRGEVQKLKYDVI